MNRKRIMRLLRWIGIIVLVFLVALYIGIPTILAVVAVLPDNGSEGTPPEGFAEVTITAEDNVQLVGWYAPPENGAVILLVHGAGNGRGSVSSYAVMLHDNGFGVLALNMRGYADSGGRINRRGWNTRDDIGAAVEYLAAQDGVEAIGGLGLSMGGEILLGAASSVPQLQAIVADGATYRSAKDYTEHPDNRSLWRSFTYYVFDFMVTLFGGGARPDVTLRESVEQADSTAFLFIAAGNVDDEVTYNTMYQEAVPDQSTLWTIPDVGHTAGFNRVPEDYEARVVAFFNEALLNDIDAGD